MDLNLNEVGREVDLSSPSNAALLQSPYMRLRCAQGQLTHFTFSSLLTEGPSVSPLMLKLF